MLLASVFLAGTIHAVTQNRRSGIQDPQPNVSHDEARSKILLKFREHLRAWRRIKIKNVEYRDVRDVKIEHKEERMVPKNIWRTP